MADTEQSKRPTQWYEIQFHNMDDSWETLSEDGEAKHWDLQPGEPVAALLTYMESYMNVLAKVNYGYYSYRLVSVAASYVETEIHA